MQRCIDITLGFSALLSNHVEQNLCLMLISYSLLLIIHFCLGRLAPKLPQSQLCVCIVYVWDFVGGWVTYSLLHVMTYKTKTYLSQIGAYVCICTPVIYKCLRIMMCVGSISLSCHLADVFQTRLMNERKAN